MHESVINISKQLYFDIFSVALRSDGLIQVEVNGNEEIDVPRVKEIVGAIGKIGEGQKFPVLLIVGEYTLPTFEARNYIATRESDPYASAAAYVVQSLSQKLVGNVFLNFNKPARPTRIFNSEQKAVQWLLTFL